MQAEAPAEEYLPGTRENLDVNICPYIEQNPDTKFVVFFPPYSILFWNDVVVGNHLEATLAQYRYLAERLNAYDNVEVYFFPDREDIILDLNNYADYSHYHPRYNRFMAECFADGSTGLVAKEGSKKGKTIDEYLSHMKTIVQNYDFEELLSGE